MPAHDKAQGQNGSVRARKALLQLGQGIKKDVHALVVHFIAAGNGENTCIGGQFATQEPVGGFNYARPVFRGPGAVYGIIGDNPHIQTVGGDDIGLPPQQHRGFLAGDGADGGKNVRLARAGCLKRPLGRDVQGCGLVGGIDAAQI